MHLVGSYKLFYVDENKYINEEGPHVKHEDMRSARKVFIRYPEGKV